MVAPNPLLEELGRAHGATKTTHGYLRRYAELFEARREAITSVLEIGVQEGGSLRMWEAYFPNANIVGVDIDPSYEQHAGGRRSVVVGSSTDPATAARVKELHPSLFDVIIDDGSHHPADQLRTFELFFPLLRFGGFYCIEDIGHTRGPLRIVVNSKLKELVDAVNYWPRGMSAGEFLTSPRIDSNNYWINNVEGLRFFRGLSIIQRTSELQTAPSLAATSEPRSSAQSIRPKLQASRLRELRMPWQFRGRRFVKRREVSPEPQWKLLIRWLKKRW